MVCYEQLEPSEIADKVTSRCKETRAICASCLEQWLEVSVGTGRGAYNKLECPQCRKKLKFADVKRHASSETFARYETLTLRAALGRIKRFRFCLAPNCHSGQIIDKGCPVFKCVACASVHCTRHNVAHEGISCVEFDEQNEGQKQSEASSTVEVAKSTHKCPRCRRGVSGQRDVRIWFVESSSLFPSKDN
jgi:hypothetical protein